MDSFDAVAFGCPSMGNEQLEEDEFEPMFSSCEEKLKDKKIALFGSYGWGDGEWMQSWEETCKKAGAEFLNLHSGNRGKQYEKSAEKIFLQILTQGEVRKTSPCGINKPTCCFSLLPV